MNHTTNYQLSQWESTDRILMSDFNSDNAKLDAALGTLAQTVTGHTTALAQKGNCRIEYQTYTGNIVTARYGDTSVTSAYSTSSGSGISSINATWSGSTLSFFANTAAGQLNVNGRTYWALAFYLLDEA